MSCLSFKHDRGAITAMLQFMCLADTASQGINTLLLCLRVFVHTVTSFLQQEQWQIIILPWVFSWISTVCFSGRWIIDLHPKDLVAVTGYITLWAAELIDLCGSHAHLRCIEHSSSLFFCYILSSTDLHWGSCHCHPELGLDSHFLCVLPVSFPEASGLHLRHSSVPLWLRAAFWGGFPAASPRFTFVAVSPTWLSAVLSHHHPFPLGTALSVQKAQLSLNTLLGWGGGVPTFIAP